jgi:hypothetical protein
MPKCPSWLGTAAGISVATMLACSGPPPRPPSPPHLGQSAELTPAERAYGLAPKRTEAVTYQPDVVLVERGPEAIRGVSANGLVWTIDRRAVRSNDVRQGKILFLTGRAVGRVLAVRTVDGELAVTLGPVELTDVIRDAHINIDQPIDFGQAIQYSAPEQGVVGQVTPILLNDFATPMILRRVSDDPTTIGRFYVWEKVGPGGIGMTVSSDANGLKLIGQAKLYLAQPKLKFDLEISAGKLIRAELALEGAGGLLLAFESGTDTGSRANINEAVPLPTDFSIPIIGIGVPFSITVRQTFTIQTAFTAHGFMKAKGDYKVSGGLRLGYRNGKFGVGGPTGFSTKESLLQSTQGVSLGVTGLVLRHEVKVIAGIGAFGFATGPFIVLHSSVAVARHADTDLLLRCDGATLNVDLAAGIGYIMPRAVTDAINWFLRKLNLGEIRSEAGPRSNWMKIINDHSFRPQIQGCQSV